MNMKSLMMNPKKLAALCAALAVFAGCSSAKGANGAKDTTAAQGGTMKSRTFTTREVEIPNTKSGNTLRGTLYLPGGAGKKPLVITSHELGGNAAMPWWKNYAAHWAGVGLSVLAFDFAGGGEKSRSDGKTTDMSVLTEAGDLEAVLDQAKRWDFVDAAKIVIAGGSQGGGVASVVASRRADDIASLILLYPAFYLPDNLRELFPDRSAIPEVHRRNGLIDVGKRYVTDMYDYDYFAQMPRFAKPVLIVHGDADKTAPHSYSERVATVYPNAKLHTIQDAGHIFLTAEQQGEFLQTADEFLRKCGIVK